MKKLLLLPLFTCCFMLGALFLNRLNPSLPSSLLANKAIAARVFIRCMPAGKVALQPFDSTKPFAPKLAGLGNYHFAVTTKNADAQAFFDQGLRLYYAFNHMEAYRAFAEVTHLDPDCAMGYWGQAITLGPNINAPMDAADAGKVMEAVQKAKEKSFNAAANEQALINAIARRYTTPAPQDRSALDEAYTASMQEAYVKFPADPDIASLYAEAVMDQHPWNYWAKDGKPLEWTANITGPLEKVLRQQPDHPGANHFYIHAVEASHTPQRGLTAASRLEKLMPGAGHLLHMPSHIYIRTGNYAMGSDMNEKSIKADLAYLTACNSQGLYALMYHPHNYHFLWACATLEGRSARAASAGLELQQKIAPEMMLSPFGAALQSLYCAPIFAQVRFGKWDELISSPAPDPKLVYVTAIWQYARGVALAKKGRPELANAALAAVVAAENDSSLKNISTGMLNTPDKMIAIAGKILAAEIAWQQKEADKAVALLTAAVALEDALNYNEPADWHHPVRELLGQVLNEAGQPALAEKYYREDLFNYPRNGWALAGLRNSLEAQRKYKQAAAIKKQYDIAFVRADIDPGRSAY